LESLAKRGENGAVDRCRSVLSDISERKKSEEVMRQVDRFHAIADLTSGIAHNFNNLIQIVIGNATLGLMNLQFGNVAEVKESLQQIVESAKFGAETVVRLNTYARGSSEDETATIEIFDLSDLVTQAVEMSKPWWKSEPEKHGIGISLRMRLTEGCLIRGRKNEMFEVLVNLIRNAVAALPEGGDIDIVTGITDRSVVLEVKDTGIGISEDNLKRLFTPFFSTSPETGRGLGLATCRRIVDGHGGTILAASLEKQGSTFTITLPLVSEKPLTREPAKPSGHHDAHTILVVDDREATVKMLKAGLGRFGHTVFTALSGREAITILKQKRMDVVICDLGMPDMNGWQVGKKVKDMFREKGIPKPAFVIFTGWENQRRDRDRIVEAGVDAVIQKPVDIAKLLTTIGEVTKKPPEP
jgi:CheY-like chemotaxis protein